jgi:hypothetical protein
MSIFKRLWCGFNSLPNAFRADGLHHDADGVSHTSDKLVGVPRTNCWPILIGGAIVIVILAFFALVNRPATPMASMSQSASEEAFWKKIREDGDREERENEESMRQMIEEQKKQLFDIMQKR